MNKIEKQTVKGFNVDKATEDQLNDLNTYELIDIVLFFREQLQRCEQEINAIKEKAKQEMDDKQIIAVQTMLNGSPDPKNKVLQQIIQKCDEVLKS